jgi:3-isopropylmalate dehydrogenase
VADRYTVEERTIQHRDTEDINVNRPAANELRTVVVACLAGHGIGPEVMAEASRALAEVSRQHGFFVEEVHPPFGGEALHRAGHPLPAATREAILSADAVLVTGSMEPALDGVKAGLDLAVCMTRTLLDGGGTLTIVAPLHHGAEDRALERAFAVARSHAGRIASVGVNGAWRTQVDRHADRHDGVAIRHLSLAAALHALTADPGSLDVVVTERVLADALFGAPRLTGGRHLTATGLLPQSGPGLFGPTHGTAFDIAGQGVANPSEMLLAAALLLDEGVGRRAAAQALEESLAVALSARRTPDMSGPGVAATTREFVDVVLGLLPSARRDTEFAMGVGR